MVIYNKIWTESVIKLSAYQLFFEQHVSATIVFILP